MITRKILALFIFQLPNVNAFLPPSLKKSLAVDGCLGCEVEVLCMVKPNKNNDVNIEKFISLDEVKIPREIKKEVAGVGDLEPFIIMAILGIASMRSVLMRRDKEEDEESDTQPEIDADDQNDNVENIPLSPASVISTVATVLASLLIPFFDLDAALMVTEVSPLHEIQFVRQVPHIKQIDLIDDIFDVEGVWESSLDEDDVITPREPRNGRSNFGNVIVMSSSVVVSVLGTTLAKVRKGTQTID